MIYDLGHLWPEATELTSDEFEITSPFTKTIILSFEFTKKKENFSFSTLRRYKVLYMAHCYDDDTEKQLIIIVIID